MTNPITPPPELVQQWEEQFLQRPTINGCFIQSYIAAKAAQWGADQELEACVELTRDNDGYDAALGLRAARRPEPVAPVWVDIHYAWELEDADGEWQAGGSANSLEDVQREGNRYLQTYLQDGPHKLIIQRHCVNTIEEVTND